MKIVHLIWFVLLTLVACQSAEWNEWEKVYQSGNLAQMDSFIQKHPQSSHIDAYESQREKANWAYATFMNTTLQYKQYLTEYPSGVYADSVHTYIQNIVADSLDFQDLTRGTFVGSIISPNFDSSVISIRFVRIQTNDDLIELICDINIDKQRYQLSGQIDPTSNHLQFTSNLSSIDPIPLCEGRIYIRNNKLLIQSVHVSQHWSVLKYK